MTQNQARVTSASRATTLQRAAGPPGTKQQLQALAANLLTWLFNSSRHKSSVGWRYGTQSQTQVFPCAQDVWALFIPEKVLGTSGKSFIWSLSFSSPPQVVISFALKVFL